MTPTRLFVFTVLLVAAHFLSSCGRRAPALPDDMRDAVTLGDVSSEKTHSLSATLSEPVSGLLGQPARRLLPRDPATWDGGSLSFTMKVDPEKPNYFTAKFSGDETTDNRLMLYADGKQIGWRHLGEVEQLDFGTAEAAYPGRFYYHTSPLPLALTKGKTELHFEVRSSGRIWGYGNTFERYQKPMTEPSRGIYGAYTHTDGFFVPPSNEKQGRPPEPVTTRSEPGSEVLDQIKTRVNKEILARLDGKAPPSQMQMQLLARAYDVDWTKAYQNPKTITRLVEGLDRLYMAFRADPKLAQAEPSTWNPDWFGLGVCGEVIALRREQLAPRFDEEIENGRGGKITRRAAWTEMLLATRDWHRLNRRQYTNQTMINDLNGIYHPNRGLAVLSPDLALPEAEARRYLYESVGLAPWRNSDPGGRMSNVGPEYWQLTDKGLTKELGYVGSYGEVTDLVAEIYNATRPSPHEEGDEKIKAQLAKIARARAPFRHPGIEDGHRAMRMEQIVGWRDSYYPGHVTYGQRATRDASALQAAAITRDPHLIGYAQQMIADNQFFASEVTAMEDTAQPLRTTIGRLETPGHHALLASLPASPHRLPMTSDQPDFVFSDEENGVVAIKHGEEILYASLYWRARNAVNNLARVHYLTTDFDRIAEVREETQFTPVGEFVLPNQTNMAFGNGGVKYPGPTLVSAHAGEKQSLASPPPGQPAVKPGQESPFAGRADFYLLRYGPWLIGLNMSKDKTFPVTWPANAKPARELASGRAVAPGTTEQIGPRTTVVYRAEP